MSFKAGDKVAIESFGGSFVPAIITKVLDGGAYAAETRDGLNMPREWVAPNKVRKMTKEEEEEYIEADGSASSPTKSKTERKG
jgi:hypothetical protein